MLSLQLTKRSGIKNINLPKLYTNSKSARHFFKVWTKPLQRDQILEQLQKDGIGVAVNYHVVHLLKFYREPFDYKEGVFPNNERIGDSTISISLYSKLTNWEIYYVIKSSTKAVSKHT